jgi:hypothetical protein
MASVSDDQVMLSSAEKLQEMITIMNETLMEEGMKVNATKTKVLEFERDERKTTFETFTNGEKMKQLKEFVYLGSLLTRDGK